MSIVFAFTVLDFSTSQLQPSTFLLLNYNTRLFYFSVTMLHFSTQLQSSTFLSSIVFTFTIPWLFYFSVTIFDLSISQLQRSTFLLLNYNLRLFYSSITVFDFSTSQLQSSTVRLLSYNPRPFYFSITMLDFSTSQLQSSTFLLLNYNTRLFYYFSITIFDLSTSQLRSSTFLFLNYDPRLFCHLLSARLSISQSRTGPALKSFSPLPFVCTDECAKSYRPGPQVSAQKKKRERSSTKVEQICRTRA